MVRHIHISVDKTEYAQLEDAKGERTWKEVLMDGAEAGDSE